MKIIEDLEGRMYEGLLGSLGLHSGDELCSQVIAMKPKGIAWSCVGEELGKGSAPEGGGHGVCPYCSKPLEFKESLDSALRHKI